jgi:acyl carrier protein
VGLDAVELVMEVEEAFGISIPDGKAEQMLTVGNLYDYVVDQVHLAPAANCLTAAAFYEIRAGLRELGITARFGPSTLLVEVLPQRHRRSFWSHLGRTMQLQLPNLVRPLWIVIINAMVTLVAAAICATLIAMTLADSSFAFAVVGIVLLFVFGFLTELLTRPFAKGFASEYASFRRLAERVLALNVSELKKSHGPMAPNDVWIVLQNIITHQLGVDADEVTRDAHFVKDLGCD